MDAPADLPQFIHTFPAMALLLLLFFVTFKIRNIILFCSPIYPEEEADEENIADDPAELNMNKVEDEMILVRSLPSYASSLLKITVNSFSRALYPFFVIN